MKRFLAIFSSAAAFLFTFSAAGKSKIRLIRQKKLLPSIFPSRETRSTPHPATSLNAAHAA
jgi:hypothetical protein